MDVSKPFIENGYFLAKNVFSPAEVAGLEREFDAIVAQVTASGEEANAKWGGAEMQTLAKPTDVVLHTHNVQQYSAAWARALYQERFLGAAREILGEDIVLHHTKLFQKPAETGAPFPMHQDWSYFPTERDTMIAAIIHVSPATDQMGCLRVVPGSHKLGRQSDSGGQGASSVSDLDQATPLEAEPGDVAFFHYFTLHGSKPNRSDQVRKTVLVQMHAGDDAVEPGHDHPYERLVLSGRNHRLSRSAAGMGKG